MKNIPASGFLFGPDESGAERVERFPPAMQSDGCVLCRKLRERFIRLREFSILLRLLRFLHSILLRFHFTLAVLLQPMTESLVSIEEALQRLVNDFIGCRVPASHIPDVSDILANVGEFC